MNTQLKKGVLELCVLSVLSKKDCYGYELINEISKHISISDGTVYPILRRLTKEGYFTTYLQESMEGPPRKYYRLTSIGYNYKESLEREWLEFQNAVNNIIIGGYTCE
ncbi:MAG: PadR family transcriptional regulator [Clostridium baratii]|uniref:Transcriptional regulator PadR-like family protein n=1 Tax=Clostridium baratii str. Sullivan TaxID=1415775 RepID=A0A0A7FVR1_9CLOT|nr:PadR family transcriptional regulator [Clostridium baratii]AIY83709.1 transcriptional regulator PadR-like family protein [Clostridium baratii str. Sullivan]MBS6007159.1 PadR family transcriptional regulator [Clostridium baratii]MDU1054084.1 PadR family transcriptional regulator [Clostridium baratii]MDU4911039.1 PadR family transcriptional regulator [Clostridium baratii]CUP50067.1 transcriptional regulator [Clostridium baratii]